ncbi:hypothetical protein [Dethiosulfatarculus sandiegensis]|nr:hypothetical protein [Dethiosulfatarculus sandiegensis]
MKKEGAFKIEFPPGIMLVKFLEVFNLGANAGLDGACHTTCPYGLPELPEWSQRELLLGDNPEQTAWLLGWHTGELRKAYKGERFINEEINSAGMMAALLWYGLWEKGHGSKCPDPSIRRVILEGNREGIPSWIKNNGWTLPRIPHHPDHYIGTTIQYASEVGNA